MGGSASGAQTELEPDGGVGGLGNAVPLPGAPGKGGKNVRLSGNLPGEALTYSSLRDLGLPSECANGVRDGPEASW